MLLVHGGRKSNRKHSRKNLRRLRGGHSPSPLSPADFVDGANMSDLAGNFAKPPNAFPSNQVGGGYGFVNNEADIPSFAGSYFPVSKVCTAGEFDLARGGNNFVGGGSKSLGLSRSGGGRRSKRSSSSKKTCGGTRRKFKQSGCNKKGGKRRRTHRRRRSHRRRQQRGGLPIM